MTSGTFHSIPLDSIIIKRDERQRRELKAIPELGTSLKLRGLIHPVLVTRDDHVLIAGERRVAAAKSLGWTHIAAQYQDEVDENTLRILELEENTRRQDLTWQEQCKAVEDYHAAQLAIDPSWTQAKTAEALNASLTFVTDKLGIAEEMKVNPVVAGLTKLSIAKNYVQRQRERRQSGDEKAISTALGEVKSLDRPILNLSFIDWAPTYEGPRFNLIHCDFPYGINMEHSDQAAGARAGLGDYGDSEEDYWKLLNCFADHLERFAEAQCHLVFWFSMKFYTETIEFLHDRTDFRVEPFPLIWHKSDDVGIIPDAQRGPRRVYETALFASRGDRKIVRAKSNAISFPRGQTTHMSQKPEPVLRHFLEMLTDSSTSLFDPTCGSGTALRAAEALGAKHVLGLEINPDFAEKANTELQQARMAREIEV